MREPSRTRRRHGCDDGANAVLSQNAESRYTVYHASRSASSRDTRVPRCSTCSLSNRCTNAIGVGGSCLQAADQVAIIENAESQTAKVPIESFGELYT